MYNEAQIIRQCLKNNPKAQKLLYEKYASILLGICMRYAKDRSEAEDILQEGFLKIFLHINQFSGTASFEGWMKRIIVNTAITYYHKNIKHRYHDDIDEINDSKVASTGAYDSEFTRDELLHVIRKLPDGYRVVFNLYAIEGYKHKEIAEILNIDMNTSKSQYSRAKRIIQHKLNELSKEKTGK